MEERSEHTESRQGQQLLHNTGGPRSRTRTEQIERSIIRHPGLVASAESLCLCLPAAVTDPEEWLLDLARKEGFSGWKAVEQHFILPGYKMTVTEPPGTLEPATGTQAILRTALILSRTNGHRYLPEGPSIFTRHRLHRSLRLVEINLNSYYEMD